MAFGLGQCQAPELGFINSTSRGHVIISSGITGTIDIKLVKFLPRDAPDCSSPLSSLGSIFPYDLLLYLHIKHHLLILQETFKMTYTVVMLVYRNPQMTPDQFKDH